MADFLKNDIFGSYQIACECLNDTERTQALKNSIKRLVSNRKKVLELGAGTGILSMFAATFGAEDVCAIEIAKPVADIAKKNILRNKLQDKITVINKDALKLTAQDIPIKPELVIMEMITTGLIEELQIPAFNNLITAGIVSTHTISSPASFETYASLAFTNFFFHGMEIRAILHQESWQRNIIEEELTDREVVSSIDFNGAFFSQKKVEPRVNALINFQVKAPGRVNSVLLNSEAILDDGSKLGWTTALNTPIIIPIDELIVRKGSLIKLRISYIMGGGLEGLRVDLVEIHE